MGSLVQAFATLSNYPQFILWKSVQRGDRTDKLPVNPHTGAVQDAHDPAIWLGLEAAEQRAADIGVGVGFVFTAADPLFFIDIDNCLQADGQWSPLAIELCGRFPGALMEVSQSGRGLHIIGTGIAPPGIKKKGPGFDLYTEGRFVALTGINARGDVSADNSPALTRLASDYLEVAPVLADFEWTTEPVKEWNGYEDDGQLIEKMLQSKSAGSAFGGRASVVDLWEANADVLVAAFPAPGDQPFDHSSADASMVQHLAFWTGKNCERIDRLFRRSQLFREKWDEREDYRQATIAHAVGLCDTVYTGRQATVKPAPASGVTDVQPPKASSSIRMITREGFQFLTAQQQLEYFAGCVYVNDVHRILTPDGFLLKSEQFKAMYGGYVFSLDTMNDKTTRNAWEAFTESQAFNVPKVRSACFRPELKPGAIITEENQSLVNTYIPIETPRKQGDPGPFLEHLKRLLPVERDRIILISYMAALVQHPGVKFQWSPLLQGIEGNGKSTLINILEHAVGYRYTHLPNAADLGGNGAKFTAWLQNKLFIGVQEIYVSDKREVSDALKPLITDARIEIQGKGADQVTGDNRANFFMCSNHKDAVLKTKRDRRYCVFYTAQQSMEDLVREGWIKSDASTTAYFPNLFKWLRADGFAIANNYLREYEIPVEFNPAADCTRAPATSSTAEAFQLSLGGIEQEIIECVEQGLAGWAGGWISSLAFTRLLESKGAARRISHNKRREILEGLGYTPHPNLKDGRVDNVVASEGGKPRLYIKAGSLAANFNNSKEIVDAYLRAQSESGPTESNIFTENPISAVDEGSSSG